MNHKVKQFIGNFSYVVTSNLTSTLISTITILIVPKLLGVSEYGYWQLYLLYSSYTGFLQFGWCDGIYLRYGGKDYCHLNKGLMKSQLVYVLILYIFVGVVILGGVACVFPKHVYVNILLYTGISGLITTARGFFYFILQATNRFKEYARMTFLDRVSFGVILIVFLACGLRRFEVIVLADLLGKLISMIGIFITCKDILFSQMVKRALCIQEGKANVRAGIKLMFASIASMLIIGIVRLGIEAKWDIETFSKVSLTLSISNLLMVFINAVGLVMFPVLKRTEEKELPKIYKTVRTSIMIPLLAMFIFYYPVKEVLSIWLPKYADSLRYMALLFPLCVFESKMALLINTYLKALRKEKQILIVNVITVFASLILSYITINFMENLVLSIILIVVLIGFRCFIAECYISKMLHISTLKDFFAEIVLSISFMFVSWQIDSFVSTIIYMLVYILYLLLKKNDVSELFQIAKMLKKRKI